MIKITSNIKEVQAKFRQAERGILKAQVKTVKGATLAGQRFARRIAPVDTGALRQGIIRRPVIRKGKVVSSALISTVNKSFPYQKWVNEDIHTVTLPTVKFQRIGKWPTARWLDAHQDKLKKWTYRSTSHPRGAGYFNLTAAYMSKIFPQFAVKELNTELKIAFQK